MANMLLTIPAISSRLNSWQSNRLPDGEVDSLADYQKFSSLAQ